MFNLSVMHVCSLQLVGGWVSQTQLVKVCIGSCMHVCCSMHLGFVTDVQLL